MLLEGAIFAELCDLERFQTAVGTAQGHLLFPFDRPYTISY